jgi:uncharacterized protein
VTSVPPSYQHSGALPPRPELPEGAHLPAEPPPLPRVGVPWWVPFVVAVAAFIVAQLVAVIVIVASGTDVENLSDSDALLIGSTVVLDAALVLCAVWAVYLFSDVRPTPATFGLRLPSFGPALGWTLAVYGTFWACALLAFLVFGDAEDQDIVTELKAEDSAGVLIAFGVMTCLIAPLAEEFFFRGFLFRVLNERIGVVWAVAIGGFAFGLVHLPSGDYIGAIVLSALGMALCVLLLRTSSLVPCIMLHAFHNSISFGFTKELPWWGFLLLTAGSVMTTFAVSLLAMRVGRRTAPVAA